MPLNSTLFYMYEKYMMCMGTAGHSLFLFQALRIWQTGSSHDVSLVGFLIAFISIASWLLYGILIKDKALIVVNIFGFCASLVCLTSIITASYSLF